MFAQVFRFLFNWDVSIHMLKYLIRYLLCPMSIGSHLENYVANEKLCLVIFWYREQHGHDVQFKWGWKKLLEWVWRSIPFHQIQCCMHGVLQPCYNTNAAIVWNVHFCFNKYNIQKSLLIIQLFKTSHYHCDRTKFVSQISFSFLHSWKFHKVWVFVF